MARPRDNQRSKVYTAEDVLSPVSANYETVREMEQVIKACLNASWFRTRFPRDYFIRVTDGRGSRKACCVRRAVDVCILKMPRWARKDYILLHELAHAITADKYAPHGPEFCANYLYLIRNFLGSDKHIKIIDSFKEHNVQFCI